MSLRRNTTNWTKKNSLLSEILQWFKYYSEYSETQLIVENKCDKRAKSATWCVVSNPVNTKGSLLPPLPLLPHPLFPRLQYFLPLTFLLSKTIHTRIWYLKSIAIFLK